MNDVHGVSSLSPLAAPRTGAWGPRLPHNGRHSFREYPMQILEFDLDGEYVELKQLLKLTDLVSSGGEAKMAISEGLVLVDGAVELRKACKIRAGQQVEFNDSVIRVLALPPEAG